MLPIILDLYSKSIYLEKKLINFNSYKYKRKELNFKMDDLFRNIFGQAFADMDKIFSEMDSTFRHFAFGVFSVADSERPNRF